MQRVRDAVSTEDVALEAAGAYFWFAERFGWTPRDVEECPAWIRDRLPTVAAVHDEVVEERGKANAGDHHGRP